MLNRTHIWFGAFILLVFAAGAASGVALDRAMGFGLRRPGFRGGVERSEGVPGQSGNPGMGRGGRDGRGNGQPGGPPTEAFVNELDQVLKLTADQKTKITAIIDASRPRLRTLQEDASKKFSDEQAKVTAEITTLLSPDQAKKLDEFQLTRRGGPFGFRGRGRR